MRWPLRNQILLPFLLIQILAIGCIAALSAWSALRRTDAEVQNRLGNVLASLRESTYPLTPVILEQLHRLSGAEFLVLDDRQRLLGKTLASGSATDLEAAAARLLAAEPTSSANPRRTWDWQDERYIAEAFRRPGAFPPQTVIVLYPQDDWNAARWRAVFPPLMIGTLLLGLTVSISFWLAQRLGRRLETVRNQVQQIAAGNFQPIQLPAEDDELRDVSAAVNHMAELLEQLIEQTRDQERSVLLTQLVAGLAHQLRNAITGARISIQLHQRRCSLTGQEPAIDVALQQLQLVEEQIKSLLRVTRGEARTPIAGPLKPLLATTAQLIEPICTHQQITFETDFADSDQLVADSDGLRAALLNLLMNAVEAAGPGGEIGLRHTSDASGATLTVRDNGPGVPDLTQIERPFFSTKQEGIGLGLALVRQVVEDSQGTLHLTRENNHTCFHLFLPATGA